MKHVVCALNGDQRERNTQRTESLLASPSSTRRARAAQMPTLFRTLSTP